MEAFSLVITPFLTLILAVTTVWLAFATWRMASISKKAFELETQPYFTFRNFLFKVFVQPPGEEGEIEKTDLRTGIIFRNPGKIPVRYEVKSLRLTFEGRTIDNPKFINSGGSIYPEDEEIFWYGTILNVDMSALPGTGFLEYEIEYSAVRKQGTVTTTRKVQYVINSLNPPNFDWIYLSNDLYLKHEEGRWKHERIKP